MSAAIADPPSKQPYRPHHIKEWAEKRGLSQTGLSIAVGADRGLVSRWFSGSSPSRKWQEKLAAFFGCEPEALFRDPDEDWLVHFFRGRSGEERARIKDTLKIAFPPHEKK